MPSGHLCCSPSLSVFLPRRFDAALKNQAATALAPAQRKVSPLLSGFLRGFR
jgi:hypothetical protein